MEVKKYTATRKRIQNYYIRSNKKQGRFIKRKSKRRNDMREATVYARRTL